MKDKIGKLAKGMLDTESPVIRISPESVREHVSAGRLHSFVLEVLSANGATIKGICYSDHPAVRADIQTFTGRRVHVSLRVDAAGMKAGDVIAGSITMVTNGGEFKVPYELSCEETSAAAEETADIVVEDPLTYGRADEAAAADPEDEDLQAQLRLLRSSIPEDMPLFEAVLSAMIRAKDSSRLTYCFCKEAIRRGLSLTRLYETYIHASPDPMTAITKRRSAKSYIKTSCSTSTGIRNSTRSMRRV